MDDVLPGCKFSVKIINLELSVMAHAHRCTSLETGAWQTKQRVRMQNREDRQLEDPLYYEKKVRQAEHPTPRTTAVPCSQPSMLGKLTVSEPRDRPPLRAVCTSRVCTFEMHGKRSSTTGRVDFLGPEPYLQPAM